MRIQVFWDEDTGFLGCEDTGFLGYEDTDILGYEDTGFLGYDVVQIRTQLLTFRCFHLQGP